MNSFMIVHGTSPSVGCGTQIRLTATPNPLREGVGNTFGLACRDTVRGAATRAST
jgi:hypothetical protein